MLLLTVVYDDSKEYIIDEIRNVRDYFKLKNVIVGISESVVDGTHFIKIFCGDGEFDDKLRKMFNLYIANVLYKVLVNEFSKKEIYKFLSETYFFLKKDEIKDVKIMVDEALQSEGAIADIDMVYCINKKNDVIDKIVNCIEENDEININGFITFRMKELRDGLESIIDKVVEQYMVEKEYTEFIKLLKYFVEVQDSKIDEVNIIIENDGKYIVKDINGNNIMNDMVSELYETRMNNKVSDEDLIISGLITTAPKKIIIHCMENCKNKEFVETIKNVFVNRVSFCEGCAECVKIKNSLKV